MKEVSFEWLNPKILSRDSKVVQQNTSLLKSGFLFRVASFSLSFCCDVL